MEGLKCLLKVIKKVIFPSTLYHYVIYEHFNISPNLLDEHFVHEPLICCSRIFQPKRHNLVGKNPLAYDKRSLILIEFVQLDLIVARESIHKT